jgi:MATE family multidrug resistance protein
MMAALVVFNFLRMGTIALTAQAVGRADPESQAALLVRALAAAAGIGLMLLAAWPWVVPLGLDLLGATGEVAREARTYVDIRYPGALLWLANAVLVGWLVGRSRLRPVLAVEVAANLIHIALDLALVLGFGWGVAGVAAATLASEAAKTLALAILISRESRAAWRQGWC